MGGGQDAEQKMVCRDFQDRRLELIDYIQRGMVILAICGSFQLLGRYYTTAGGEQIPGLDLFDFYTEGGRKRMIGDIVTRCHCFSPPRTLVGLKTTAGAPFWGRACSPWAPCSAAMATTAATVPKGWFTKMSSAPICMAPCCRKPWLADHLLQKALEYRGYNLRLKALDDTLEEAAHHLSCSAASPPSSAGATRP